MGTKQHNNGKALPLSSNNTCSKILQRLRCKCNFHALKFMPEIQRVGSLLVRRIRKYDAAKSMLDNQLLGNFMDSIHSKQHDAAATGPFKYLALHLRFEIDMVAYSLCDFGGGESERNELQAYRQVHFPLLIERLKNSKYIFSYMAFPVTPFNNYVQCMEKLSLTDTYTILGLFLKVS